jgi:hypothetical protein
MVTTLRLPLSCTKWSARPTDPDEAALKKAETERIGLKARIDDILSRAAIVGGNEIDDYLTRTEDRSTMLSDCNAEIRRGEERLKVLDQYIVHVKFLKTALRTRFPDLKSA